LCVNPESSSLSLRSEKASPNAWRKTQMTRYSSHQVGADYTDDDGVTQKTTYFKCMYLILLIITTPSSIMPGNTPYIENMIHNEISSYTYVILK
jgi:hypothetical protein